MSFISIKFFIFITIFLLLYKLFEKNSTYQKSIIILGSYIFYCMFKPYYAVILLIVSVFNWAVSRILFANKKRPLLIGGIIVNVTLLASFKYIAPLSIIMPIGLSFYIFEAISLLVDAYKGKLDKSYSLTDILLYLSFFPILVSGPIMKAHEFLPQLKEKHSISLSSFEYGIQRFLLGAFEKVVIADRLSVAVDAVYSSPAAYSGISLLWNSITYTLQLFFDFAGYTNMAIAIATIIGFNVKENFNLPYIASSPSDFWKRWHISLSSWITEYIYIPLGGNRKGVAKTLFNIMIAMTISGLWHGSTLNFLVWGLFHGLIQVIQKMAKELFPNKKKSSFAIFIDIILTFATVNFLWIPFRTDNLSMTILVLKRIFTNAVGLTYIYSYTLIFGIVLVAVEIYAILRNNGNNPIHPVNLRTFKGKLVFATLFILTLMLAYFGNGAFIYGAKF